MNSAMLNYDDFDLETATQDRLSLRDAIKTATEIRDREPGAFVRIKSTGVNEFLVVTLPAQEVYAEWMSRMRQRLARLSRRHASR